MVRASMVNHPVKWMHSGYRRTQQPPKRYGVLNLKDLWVMWLFEIGPSLWQTPDLKYKRRLRVTVNHVTGS
jgi:hypothetical protein